MNITKQEFLENLTALLDIVNTKEVANNVR